MAPPAALARFTAKCRFDPGTGCVIWTGGRTCGHGKWREYGSFWFEGRRWFAHRWAAKYIHGFDIDCMQVDHECPDTLCVQHIQAVPPEVNRALQWVRRQVGADPWSEPDTPEPFTDVPYFEPPAWLTQNV